MLVANTPIKRCFGCFEWFDTEELPEYYRKEFEQWYCKVCYLERRIEELEESIKKCDG